MKDPKQEVWGTVQAANRCWTAGDPMELKSYFHENMVAITPSDPEPLRGREMCVSGWADFARSTKIHSWQESNPDIRIHGDTAVVTYAYELSCDFGGRAATLRGRDMMTLVKEKGRWWIVSDQFSPFPKEAGE